MSIINDLLTASAAIPRAVKLSDERYDHQLRSHITYLRQLSSGKELGSIVRERTLLDVSKADMLASKFKVANMSRVAFRSF